MIRQNKCPLASVPQWIKINWELIVNPPEADCLMVHKENFLFYIDLSDPIPITINQ